MKKYKIIYWLVNSDYRILLKWYNLREAKRQIVQSKLEKLLYSSNLTSDQIYTMADILDVLNDDAELDLSFLRKLFYVHMFMILMVLGIAVFHIWVIVANI